MVKKKSPRILITLECNKCRICLSKRSNGISRYLTSKNRRNTTQKIELKKFCCYCNMHVIHKEIK
jgi:large subunit ribosomal protein L33